MQQHGMVGRWQGVVVVLGTAVLLGACSHGKVAAPAPEAQAAVDKTRGLCPTDLNETQVLVTEKDDTVRLVFFTNDPSENEALYRRVAEVGEALSEVHPAVNVKGEKVEHVPVPRPELREAAVNSTVPPRYGWELVMNVPPGGAKDQLKADLEDHVRMWRRGECPILTDESVKKTETKDWATVDR